MLCDHCANYEYDEDDTSYLPTNPLARKSNYEVNYRYAIPYDDFTDYVADHYDDPRYRHRLEKIGYAIDAIAKNDKEFYALFKEYIDDNFDEIFKLYYDALYNLYYDNALEEMYSTIDPAQDAYEEYAEHEYEYFSGK